MHYNFIMRSNAIFLQKLEFFFRRGNFSRKLIFSPKAKNYLQLKKIVMHMRTILIYCDLIYCRWLFYMGFSRFFFNWFTSVFYMRISNVSLQRIFMCFLKGIVKGFIRNIFTCFSWEIFKCFFKWIFKCFLQRILKYFLKRV